jgi:hypothetical protein
MASYTDFLGETIAESYRTGKARKPNLNNAMSKGRSKFRMKLEKDATDQGRPIEEVALDHVTENAGQIQKYIISKGELPEEETPQGLAFQAYRLRKKEVSDVARAIGCNYETAEAYLDEAENKAMDISSPEADSFLGEIFDAIGKVAGGGLQKLADKRVAKGKKPGAAGFFAGLLNPNGNMQMTGQGAAENADNTGSQIRDALGNIINAVKEDEKKKEIKKMLPMIILGVVALIVIVVLLTKATSKK